MPEWSGPKKRSDKEQQIYFFSGFPLSTSTHSGLLPMTSTQGLRTILCVWQRMEEYTGRCRAAMWSTHVHTRYVSHKSCSHVHKECACPYRARRRSVSTGGSCSHVHKEFTRSYMVQRRWVLTGVSCSHVHKDGAGLYRARRRSVATGGSCSQVHKECAHWREPSTQVLQLRVPGGCTYLSR
jgi:hypothetical protein